MAKRTTYRSAVAPHDARELVALVAAWLTQVGFQQIACDATWLDSVTLDAQWVGQGQAFRLLLQATRSEARCHLWSNQHGLVASWVHVSCVAQVQKLLRESPWQWVGEPHYLYPQYAPPNR